ncbi:FeoA family protein [Lachnospiraceae bacterium 54-53]
MESLMNVAIGDTYTVKWLICDPRTEKLMQSYHIEEGSTVRVIRRCLGSVIIGMNDRRLAIGSEVAEGIKVTPSL